GTWPWGALRFWSTWTFAIDFLTPPGQPLLLTLVEVRLKSHSQEMEGGDTMGNVLFTNVRIFDGTGAQPFAGEVLVQGNRILKVGRGPRSLPTAGIDTIDAAGATLMPGMTEAHTHFSWNDQPSLGAIQKMPLEEHILWC